MMKVGILFQRNQMLASGTKGSDTRPDGSPQKKPDVKPDPKREIHGWQSLRKGLHR
ncbi:MAG: hypothetical protein HFJ44_02295 [Clostridia bacterium]|nr:hypothetical protein [Clostridia bacterium]